MIKLEKKFLRSKVARRMLLFFMLAAFLPVLFLAFLAYWESNKLLVTQAHTRLDATSNIYKTSIYDRLLLLNQELKEISQHISQDPLSTELEVRLRNRFHHLALQSPSSPAVTPYENKDIGIESLSASAMQHLSSGKPLLLTQQQNGKARIFMVLAQQPSTRDTALLIAEIVPDYLWGDIDTFVFDTNLCVYSESNTKIFCTHSQPYPSSENINAHTRGTKGEFIWQENDKNYLANYHEIFLQAKFHTPRWLIVASQPETEALNSLNKFNMIFWSSVILSILLILLFSMIQIRRVLVPLEQLIDGTRRLGGHDFTTKVTIASSDEFGELASSFNIMSEKLGNQFEILAALSEIDREILSTLNIEKIAEDVLKHLQHSTDIRSASIAVINDNESQQMRIYRIDEKQKQLLVQTGILQDTARQLLIHHSKGVWIDYGIMGQQFGIEKTTKISQNVYILPLNWKDQMVGFIALQPRIDGNWQIDTIKYIQDYADRIAVALFTKNREELLVRQARIDALTGLPNRFLFIEQLQKEIAQAQRAEGKLAILYLDLDRFKKVNDSFGHSIGDQLLCDAGKRLQQCLRESDTVARLGGDEFAILINQLTSEHQATFIAKHIINALAEPFFIRGEENIIAASIGIAIYPQDGKNIEELMRNSDIAMYRAKAKGGSQHIFFEESMNDEVLKRATIERELRRAISEKQFVLHYQPQIDPRTNLPRGVEALVRWNHPTNGLIAPGYFIHIAEDTGLIAEIGQIILAEACSQYRQWLNQGISLEYVAVNVSVKQFCHPNFLQSVETALKENAMPAHCLELEITESVLMDDTEAVLKVLHQLKQLGVQLSIDDFGTGYSSMSYLEQLPFDTLKIDISFVRKIQNDESGGTIAATIAAMAHALSKKIVAEGVETQTQLDFLKKHDCELIQGYFFSKPLPAEDLAKYVTDRIEKDTVINSTTNIACNFE
ncbi:EAL domain-containing protein [Nitrosomonas sp.]|uniref:EAL domain-containing protein n=1 Tax=Nitrosomonas sp. TaxID=42353 RepID=UPI001DAA3EBE|nr:EAL domain-containing protein [Nitrosomonas sp.]MBX3617307.1 EAL domain-containing protein [Nitrosomonas sp.]